jgi:hypothetical protein
MSFDLAIAKGDLVIGSNGDLKKVVDNEKLVQDILKIALTPLGGNPFYPTYGSSVAKTVIGSALPFDMLNQIGSEQLRNSLDNLQKLQRAQSQRGQRVSPAETLAAIRSVSIIRNRIDPRHYTVSIDVLTKDLTSLTPNFSIVL